MFVNICTSMHKPILGKINYSAYFIMYTIFQLFSILSYLYAKVSQLSALIITLNLV